MKPGLVVKLRPSGPWRIGPDSGARNRVDVIYHSDSLYSAVTSAMSRLGNLDAWLDATARTAAPAVCFSSCFPFVEQTAFVIPPRTLWPPASPSRMAGRVRWKSARFIPLGMVQAILAGEPLDENRWTVDGPSGCLVPAGTPGPFRTSVRWGAGVDRLSGASERHSTACIEFRPGAGLWTVIGFADEGTRDQWQDAVKAAFRLLADTGFGGERSRGWGRSESPEFVEGELPGLIIGERASAEQVTELPNEPPASASAQPLAGAPGSDPSRDREAEFADLASVGQVTDLPHAGEVQEVQSAGQEAHGTEAQQIATSEIAEFTAEREAVDLPEEPSPVPPVEEPPSEQPAEEPPQPEPPEPPVTDPLPPIEEPGPPAPEPLPARPHNDRASTRSHWLLSLFTPAAADTVDWARGNYTVLARGGRVDSPAGSGELKKQIRMVAEGSVLIAEDEPRGAAADVAPEGFAHPVFRAGFALAITLPEAQ